MNKFANFTMTPPTETGFYWVSNVTTLSEPDMVLVCHVDPYNSDSPLGFQRFSSHNITPLTNNIVQFMQWQKAEWT